MTNPPIRRPDVERHDGRERIIQLCLLIDHRLVHTPFSGWDEQEAFEIVLVFDDTYYARPSELPHF